jgi:hypothetical protein
MSFGIDFGGAMDRARAFAENVGKEAAELGEAVGHKAGEAARTLTKEAGRVLQAGGGSGAGDVDPNAAADVKKGLETTTVEKVDARNVPLVGQRGGETRADYINRLKEVGFVGGTVVGGATGAVTGYVSSAASTASVAAPLVKHPAAVLAVSHLGGLIGAAVGAYNGALAGGPQGSTWAGQAAETLTSDPTKAGEKPPQGEAKPTPSPQGPAASGPYASGEAEGQDLPGLLPEGKADKARSGGQTERGKAKGPSGKPAAKGRGDAYAEGKVAPSRPGILPEKGSVLGDFDERPRARRA